MKQPFKKYNVLGYYLEGRLLGDVVLFFRKPERGGASAKAAISDLIEFGSHSLNHLWLHQLPVEEVRFEVEESKRQLEELLQKPCRVFTYPAGYFNEEARLVVEDAGHVGAVTTIYGPHDRPDLYALNRIEILRRDRFLFQFARQVEPLLSFVG